LRRSAQPRSFKLAPLGDVSVQFGQAIEVPSTPQGPIWAEIEVRPSMAGRLATAALKSPPVFLDLALADGRSGRTRLVPEVAKSGFLLSPLVENPTWFAWLACTPWSEPAWQRVLAAQSLRAMAINSEGAWAFDATVQVRFFRLEFPPMPSEFAAFSPRLLPLFQLRSEMARPSNPMFCWLAGHGAALAAPAGSALCLRVSSDNRYSPLLRTARQLRVGFGGVALRLQDKEQGRVGFSISACDMAGTKITIWEKVIGGGPIYEKTTVDHDTISLDLGDAAMLLFETGQAKPGQSLLPFWFEATCE
jgi:hypothetical protein